MARKIIIIILIPRTIFIVLSPTARDGTAIVYVRCCTSPCVTDFVVYPHAHYGLKAYDPVTWVNAS